MGKKKGIQRISQSLRLAGVAAVGASRYHGIKEASKKKGVQRICQHLRLAGGPSRRF